MTAPAVPTADTKPVIRPATPRKSVMDKVQKASDIPDKYGLNIILFGPPGTGKTTLAATAQDSVHGRNVLFIDVEGGTRAIGDRKDIDVLQPDTMDEVRDVFEWIITAKDHGYQTFVIDTVSELQQVGMTDIMRTAKDPEWPGIQDWGKSTEQMTKLVRAFRNLAQTQGWNVIFISHAREQKDEVDGRIYVRPNLTPKVTERIGGAVDVVGYLTKEDDGTRLLQIEPTRRVMAKYRQPMTGRRLPGTIRNPTLVTILEHLRGGEALQE